MGPDLARGPFGLEVIDSPANDLVVCRCLAVTEAQVREMVASGLVRSIRDFIELSGAGGGCTCCHPRLQRLLDERAGDDARVGYSSASPICSAR
jgi:bacterioferritin-associated ferredoxin